MRFNDLPQLINTLSLLNEDFAGLDNFNKLLKSFNKFLRTSSACRGLQGSWIGAAKSKIHSSLTLQIFQFLILNKVLSLA